METATIPVRPEIARHYNSMSPQAQRKVQALLSVWMKAIERGGGDALDEIMDTISNRAAERGLTPEILEALLADES